MSNNLLSIEDTHAFRGVLLRMEILQDKVGIAPALRRFHIGDPVFLGAIQMAEQHHSAHYNDFMANPSTYMSVDGISYQEVVYQGFRVRWIDRKGTVDIHSIKATLTGLIERLMVGTISPREAHEALRQINHRMKS